MRGLDRAGRGHPALARPLHEQARPGGRRRGRGTGHALASQSLLYVEMARAGSGRESARQALRLAYHAADKGRYVPVARLHALATHCRASAASPLGDKAAFTAAISQAERELDWGPRDADRPQWLRRVGETEVTGAEAGCARTGNAPECSRWTYSAATRSPPYRKPGRRSHRRGPGSSSRP